MQYTFFVPQNPARLIEKVGKEIRKLYSWSDEDKLINN